MIRRWIEDWQYGSVVRFFLVATRGTAAKYQFFCYWFYTDANAKFLGLIVDHKFSQKQLIGYMKQK